MAKINVLDKFTAELIAAGEVVEKPASVVKELVENSIDAGAKNILVDIENGGIKKILVQDDGCGIDSEYVKTAFIRHATSKISTKDDLNNIQSLGFRGEALASIASVSKITLTTKTSIQDFAVEYKIEGGEEIDFSIKPFVDGTRFIIRDLFYNTPARMKFLKKDATEAGYIQEILINLALANPNISFTFKKDGKDIFTTVGDGNLKNTIACLFTTSFASEICSVNYEDEKYTVSGFTTYPQFSRQSRNMQFVFINGRYVKNKTVIAAVENAYKGTVMVGKFPGYVLNIEMPFDCVDVNVHPAKTEVRFSSDNEIFTSVYRAIKTSLEENQTVKKVDIKNTVQTKFFVDKENIQQQAFNIKSSEKSDCKNNNLKINITQQPKETFKTVSANEFKELINATNEVNSDKNITPYASSNYNYDYTTKRKNLFIPYEEDEEKNSKTKEVYIEKNELVNAVDYEINEETNNVTENDKVEIITENILSEVRIVGEIFNTYILCESDDNLIMIDKHAAHERLLYEKLKESQNFDNQMLLTPIGVNLSAKEKEAVINNIDLLSNQGFIIEDMGLNGVMVRAVPLNITCENPQSLIEEIAHNLSEGNLTFSEKLDWILHSVACRSAIKAGDKATETELKQLINDIRTEKIPLYCPHGRPVIISITQKEIEKQFGRA